MANSRNKRESQLRARRKRREERLKERTKAAIEAAGKGKKKR